MNKTDARITLCGDDGEHVYQWVQVAHLVPLGKKIRLGGKYYTVTGWLLPSAVKA